MDKGQHIKTEKYIEVKPGWYNFVLKEPLKRWRKEYNSIHNTLWRYIRSSKHKTTNKRRYRQYQPRGMEFQTFFRGRKGVGKWTKYQKNCRKQYKNVKTHKSN